MQETNNRNTYIWGAIVAVILIVLGFIYFSNSDKEINNTTVGDTINNATSTATSTKNNTEKPNFDYKG
jgi:hypothetical protein